MNENELKELLGDLFYQKIQAEQKVAQVKHEIVFVLRSIRLLLLDEMNDGDKHE